MQKTVARTMVARAIVVRCLVGATVLTAALGLAGCGPSGKEKRAAADARAASFTPPSVTSRLDYGSLISRRFRSLDRNADDILTATELPKQNSRLWALDRNKDGQISSIEFSEGMLARFDRADLNHDGTVTSEERQSARAQRTGG